MLSMVKTISLNGLEGHLIDVQTDINSGIPSFEIVGLPDTTVKEAKERVKTAIKNLKYQFPNNPFNNHILILLFYISPSKSIEI